jgi:tetratricopeptide (TPR) repeat protein
MVADPGYSFAAVADILTISESKLRYWSQSGFVGPSLRHGTKQLFSFQDLVSVKAAKELIDRGFSPAQIRKAIESVRVALPGVDRPLDRFRVAWNGDALVVVDEGAAFEVSGQRLFDFGLGELMARAAPEATPLDGRPAARTPYESFLEGLRHEEVGDDLQAEIWYKRALDGDAGLAAAHTNLGAIAHRRGDLEGARNAFEAALACDPDQPEARYNLASLLFDTGEIELAVAELRQVIQSAPSFADAHYNLATALERLGSKRQAREHLERYLALTSDAQGLEPWIVEARARLGKL